MTMSASGRAEKRRIAISSHRDGGAVDLVQADQMSRSDAERRSDRQPILVGGLRPESKRPVSRRKEMARIALQRDAHERRPAGGLRPFEPAARLWCHRF